MVKKEETLNYWIFQSKPGRYDLRERLVAEREEPWIASRYRTKMKPGDLVFLWMSGPPEIRGIYGWGRLTSVPFESEDGHRVKVLYQKKLREFIPVAAVKKTSALRNLMILNLAIGTNFWINEKEGRTICKLMQNDERPKGGAG